MSINAIKLQRLTYFAHCWCLAIYGSPLTVEYVEAWRYGPVFADIYNAALKYGTNPINSMLQPDLALVAPPCNDHEAVPLLKKIWSVYGDYSDVQLCHIANRGDGPWYVTLSKNVGRKNPQINEKDIAEHFLGLMSGGKSAD